MPKFKKKVEEDDNKSPTIHLPGMSKHLPCHAGMYLGRCHQWWPPMHGDRYCFTGHHATKWLYCISGALILWFPHVQAAGQHDQGMWWGVPFVKNRTEFPFYGWNRQHSLQVMLIHTFLLTMSLCWMNASDIALQVLAFHCCHWHVKDEWYFYCNKVISFRFIRKFPECLHQSKGPITLLYSGTDITGCFLCSSD